MVQVLIFSIALLVQLHRPEHKHEEMKKLEDSTERICSDSKSVDEKFENLIKENDKIIKFTLGA